MKRVFADTHFFIALLNARDEAHARAVRIEKGPQIHLLTTRWVLVELADAMASQAYRARAAIFLTLAKANPWLTILNGTDALFDQGCDLYSKRPDKAWSLTDCILIYCHGQRGSDGSFDRRPAFRAGGLYRAARVSGREFPNEIAIPTHPADGRGVHGP